MDYIFTKDSFYPDGQNKCDYDELYSFCFKPCDPQCSLTERFLYSISEFFIDNLLSSTGVELERENISIEYDKDEIERIASECN